MVTAGVGKEMLRKSLLGAFADTCAVPDVAQLLHDLQHYDAQFQVKESSFVFRNLFSPDFVSVGGKNRVFFRFSSSPTGWIEHWNSFPPHTTRPEIWPPCGTTLRNLGMLSCKHKFHSLTHSLDWLIDWLIDWLNLIDWVIDWLSDWLIDWSYFFLVSYLVETD